MAHSIGVIPAKMSNDFQNPHPNFYSELRQAILEDNSEHIRKLNHMVKQFLNNGGEITLRFSNHNYSTIFKGTNPFLFACKHAKCKALQILLSKNATPLRTLLLGNNEKEIFATRDDEGHNLFYYAMRSCDVELLRSIISHWNNTGLAENNELDELISTALKNITLRNLPFSEEMLMCVEQNLVQLRFYGQDQESNKNLNYISEADRSQLLIEYIQKLNEGYANKTVDDKFVLYSKYIIDNIYILKRQLKHTYDELPWEEMEFVLIVFLSYHVNKEDPKNVIYGSLINRKNVLLYLGHFSEKLQQTINKELKTMRSFPNINRTQIKSKIIQNDPIFEDLYSNYELVRDAFSIDVISKYINLGISCSCEDLQGQMVITRTLQVIGEYLKNTLESPKMSPTTSDYLLSFLPYNTNQILRDLRNTLCHSSAIIQMLKSETQSDSEFFRHLQNDLKKLVSATLNVENKIKLKAMEVVLNRFLEVKTGEEVKEMLDFTKFMRWNTLFVANNGNEELEEIYRIFCEILETSQDHVEYQSIFDAEILNQINNWIQSEKQNLERACLNYKRFICSLHAFASLRSLFKIDSNDVRILKWLTELNLNETSTTRDPKRTEEINLFLGKFIMSLSTQCKGERLEKLYKATHKMMLYISSEFNLSWLEELNELLVSERKTTKETYNSNNHAYKKDQLRLKINELRKFLADENIDTPDNFLKNAVQFNKNKKLKAVAEMLTLDVLSLLKESYNHLNKDFMFLDNCYTVLVGNNLRNHLAHGTSLLDMLYPESSFYSILNSERLVTHYEIGSSCKIGKQTCISMAALKKRYHTEIDILNKKIALFDSIQQGNFNSMITCIENGADILSRDLNLWTTLHYAAKGNSIDIIKYIIHGGVDISVVDAIGQNPIHIAAAYGREDNVLFFIKKNVAIDCRDNLGKTPLHIAAENDQEHVVQALVKNGASTKNKDFLRNLPLHYAVLNNHVKTTKFLLKCDGGICNTLSNSFFGCFSLLHLASERGYLDLVRLLLSNKANANVKTNTQATPLILAALNGHYEVAATLISHGADVNAKSSNDYTSLHASSENGHPKIIELLLKHGANVNSVNDENYTPLNIATDKGHIEVVIQLLKKKADVEIASIKSITPIHSASKGGYLEIVKHLLRRNASLKTVDINGATPLHLSAYFNHKDIALCLIEHGASVYATTLNGQTPLFIASQNGSTDIVEVLLHAGADINCKDAELNTPLHCSALNGHSQTAEVLVSQGALVNAKNAAYRSPLWFAAKNDRESIIHLLLENGAAVNDADENQLSPLHMSSLGGFIQVTKILISKNADINGKGKEGLTPLHLAALGNNVHIVRLLLNNCAKVDGVKTLDWTPLFIAVRNNNRTIAQLLINAGADVKRRIIGEAAGSGFKDMLQMLLKHTGCSVNCEVADGMPLLLLAVLKNHINVVNYLVNANANVNIRLESEATLLHIACESGYTDIVNTLLKNKAKPGVRSQDGATPLHLASMLGHVEEVKLLLKYGANPNLADGKNRTSIEQAVAYMRLDVVKVLLKQKEVNINDRGNEDFSLLHIAAQEGDVESVKYLVDHGADVNASNMNGAKPIHIAAREGKKESVHFLLKKTNINVLNQVNGHNLLHYAAINNQTEIAKCLIDENIDTNHSGRDGNTPLHLASALRQTEFVKLLLNSGAYYNSINAINNMTPMKMATSPNNFLFNDLFLNCISSNYSGSTDIVTLLSLTHQVFQAVKQNNPTDLMTTINRGACLDAKNSDNVTVLHYAAWKGYNEIVDILLEHGANPNIAGKSDCTPLHYACKFHHSEIVKKLIKGGAFYDIVSSNRKLPLHFASHKDIIDFLVVLKEAFDHVKNGDIAILSKLQNMENNLRFNILKARNKDNKNILTVAMSHDFPKLKTLETLYHFEHNSTDKLYKKGVALLSLGKFEESLLILRQVLRKRKSLFGNEDRRTIEVMSKIGIALYSQNKYPEALTAHEEAFKYQNKVLGADNQQTLSTKEIIGLIRFRLGEFKESLVIFEEVLPKQIEILGPDHADVLSTESDMALVLNKLGRHEEAIKLNQRIFEKRKATLGPNNPATLVTQNNIAIVLASDGKLSEALEIFKEVYQKRKSVLGLTHLHTFSTAQSMIEAYTHLRMYDEATKLADETIKGQERSLGKYHTSTIGTRFALVNLYFVQGKFVEAINSHEKYIEMWKIKVGSNNPIVRHQEIRYEQMKKSLSFMTY